MVSHETGSDESVLGSEDFMTEDEDDEPCGRLYLAYMQVTRNMREVNTLVGEKRKSVSKRGSICDGRP